MVINWVDIWNRGNLIHDDSFSSIRFFCLSEIPVHMGEKFIWRGWCGKNWMFFFLIEMIEKIKILKCFYIEIRRMKALICYIAIYPLLHNWQVGVLIFHWHFSETFIRRCVCLLHLRCEKHRSNADRQINNKWPKTRLFLQLLITGEYKEKMPIKETNTFIYPS